MTLVSPQAGVPDPGYHAEQGRKPIMKPYDAGQRIVRNLHTTAFKPLQVDGLAYEGLSYLQLDHRRQEGTGLHVLKMAPGTTSLPHEHTSDEIFFVLEGELVDFDGTRYKAGDMVLLRAGTVHSSHSPAGCTLIFYMDTLEKPA
jgi:mannose-6-phosphate isomerase-like protein (cupin superfamily)